MSSDITLYGLFINGSINTYIKYISQSLEQIKECCQKEIDAHKHSRHHENKIIIISIAPGEEIIPTYEWSIQHKVDIE